MQFDGSLCILLCFEAHFAPIPIRENGKIKAHKQSGNGTSHKQQQNWLNFVPMAFVWQSFDVIFAECFHFPCAAFLFPFHQKNFHAFPHQLPAVLMRIFVEQTQIARDFSHNTLL